MTPAPDSRPRTAAPATRPAGPGGPVWARALLLVVPAVWLGLLIGISLIEAPLKFTAPGITIPLGLGIGRRVFFAMNLVEVVLVLVLVLALVRSLGSPPWARLTAPGASRLWLLGLLSGGLLLIKFAAIRPFLNQRTDAVLAGEFAGGSNLHYAYIAVDSLLIIALVLMLALAARALLAPQRATAQRR